MEVEQHRSITQSRSQKPILLKFYLRKLDQNPILTKAITSDVLSQIIVRVGRSKKEHFSWRSTAAFATFSMVVTGPVTHYIYQFLEGAVPKQTEFASAKKAILERLLFAPPYLLALFYSVAIMEGKSHQEAWKKVKEVYWPALFKNVIVWGIAQFFNMRYIPVKYRVLFGNIVALVWNTYLALLRR